MGVETASTPHLRHQISFERLAFPPIANALTEEQYALASNIFLEMISFYESGVREAGSYDKVALVKLTYESAEEGVGKSLFLGYFLSFMAMERNGIASSSVTESLRGLTDFTDWEPRDKEQKRGNIYEFAQWLVDCFFLKIKGTANTPQPTPASSTALSSVSLPPEVEAAVGVTNRLSTLRKRCLIRDHNRCVITRTLDENKAAELEDKGGSDAQDQDGNFLRDEETSPAFLEVAHIIPHSIMSTDSGQLNDQQLRVLDILRIFDSEILSLIEGENIDRPYNAITLTLDMHRLFGSMMIIFEPADDSPEPHTYTIHELKRRSYRSWLPITRTLLLSSTRSIDPPSHRLFAVHAACAKILYMSGAGEYIDRVLRDQEEPAVRGDGSTELGGLVAARLGGSWNGVVRWY